MSKEDEELIAWLEESRPIPRGKLNLIMAKSPLLTKVPPRLSFTMPYDFSKYEKMLFDEFAFKVESRLNEMNCKSPYKEGAD